jgi:hypothetical protein
LITLIVPGGIFVGFKLDFQGPFDVGGVLFNWCVFANFSAVAIV